MNKNKDFIKGLLIMFAAFAAIAIVMIVTKPAQCNYRTEITYSNGDKEILILSPEPYYSDGCLRLDHCTIVACNIRNFKIISKEKR